MLIREVILEDFMSYEYARVPLKDGVNVICGPNGSGKSSLLLAISVALGQSYTERSRKLSDLIRWGKNQARVTLTLDNTRKDGKRPIPRFGKDQIFLTRILRRDGQYWFELENRAVTKAEVDRFLSKLGVDPNNMLIIMHQNMVEQFTVLSQQEKLRMVEEAVGLESFRRNVLEAQKKLARTLSQEESTSKLLESAEQTLNYWREQYERYQEKKQLLAKRRFSEREWAWAEVGRLEEAVNALEAESRIESASLSQIQEEAKALEEKLQKNRERLERLRSEWKSLFEARLNLEREKAADEAAVAIYKQLLTEAAKIEKLSAGGANPHEQTVLSPGNHLTHFNLIKTESLKQLIQNHGQNLVMLKDRISENQVMIGKLDKDIEKAMDEVLGDSIKISLLKYRLENVNANLQRLEQQLKSAKIKLSEASSRAEQTGPRIAVVKSIGEIIDEIRITDGHLAALANVSEDVERMYESYSELYLELKEKAKIVAENREKALEEIKTRMQTWRSVIQSLLDRVSLGYQKILSQCQAAGEVRLVNEHDIEAAGLEILVGFKGGKPVPLDAYTQSGGERTTATMGFLLALQQHVRSPFRAVDEYDVHMDPKNRELIANLLVSIVKDAKVQYVVITPSHVTFANHDLNVIIVQNVEGKSIVRRVA